MSVGAVTYKEYGWRQKGKLPPTRTVSQSPSLRLAPAPKFSPPAIRGRAVTGTIFKPPTSLQGFGIRSAIQVPKAGSLKLAQAIALRKLSRKLVPKQFRLAEIAVRLLATYIRRTLNQPAGFPGWENITAWKGPAQEPLGYSPGDFVPNPFDHSPTWTAFRVASIDVLTCGLPQGCQFWGDYPGYDPTAPGAPDPHLEETVHITPRSLAQTRLRSRLERRVATLARSQTVYRKLPNLAPAPQAQPWGPRSNVTIRISTAMRDHISVSTNTARIRDRNDKAKPKNEFVYFVLLAFANAAGEQKEWIDILAEAADYKKYNRDIPRSLDGKETLKKAFWLFAMGGINQIDFDILALLIVENELEDAVFGFFGQLSKAAARSLGMPVGFQFGPAL